MALLLFYPMNALELLDVINLPPSKILLKMPNTEWNEFSKCFLMSTDTILQLITEFNVKVLDDCFRMT